MKWTKTPPAEPGWYWAGVSGSPPYLIQYDPPNAWGFVPGSGWQSEAWEDFVAGHLPMRWSESAIPPPDEEA